MFFSLQLVELANNSDQKNLLYNLTYRLPPGTKFLAARKAKLLGMTVCKVI